MATREAIKNLSCAAIDTKPVDADWSEGWTESWEFWTGDKCDRCGAVVVGQGEDLQHRDVDSECKCTGSVALSGPMMNYYYPVQIDDVEDAARKLAGTCLCVVKVGDVTGLALTGGGMDLSWEICEAFMLLGYLPPAHFADLPGLAGKDVDSRRNRWIVAGCLKSCAVAASWATGRAKRLRQTVASMRKDAKKRAA